jgi:formylglycine-generating enzyme required for sulfatase activity
MSLCLACGAANPLDTKFCSQCRSKLLIQERYRALLVIGQGSFGKTFLAQDEAKPSKPKCVIKQFLYDDPETIQDAKRLFEQEAVHLDDLGKHPQIPELLAHAEHEGRQYLVQEFIDGDNLNQELKLSGAFSEAKIEKLLLDLLPVLQFIHAGEVIHRDIKPDNIIRRRADQKLVLVDFGAAKVASQTALQKTGTTIGSSGYASPEQAFGKVLFSSDIYSLGVTCLHLLTNANPSTMYDPIEGFIWRKFLSNNTTSKKLGKILDKMTQATVKNRYQSVDELLKVIQPSQISTQPKAPQSQGSIKSSITTVTKQPTKQSPSIQISPQVVQTSAPTVKSLQRSSQAKVPQAKVSGKSSITASVKKSTQIQIVSISNPVTTIRKAQPIQIASQTTQIPKSSISHSLVLDCGKGVTLELVDVVAGSFSMGSNDYDFGSEKPIHKVTLKAFKMSKYPITQKQYRVVMGNNPSRFKSNQNCPVEQVSWDDAVAFCEQLSQMTGQNVNLPSEAQWEYACRAGSQTKYCFGDNINQLGNYAWYDTNSGKKTHPVGEKLPNSWGLYDMHGNVWEWCEDVYHKDYHGAPNDGIAWLTGGQQHRPRRTIRGGSWFDFAINCRSADRYNKIGAISHSSNSRVGFRIVV